MPSCPSSACWRLYHEPARRTRRPVCVMTKPVCRFFQGNRISAAQRMLAARKPSRRANPGLM
jgi:hypothetical protein